MESFSSAPVGKCPNGMDSVSAYLIRPYACIRGLSKYSTGTYRCQPGIFRGAKVLGVCFDSGSGLPRSPILEDKPLFVCHITFYHIQKRCQIGKS